MEKRKLMALASSAAMVMASMGIAPAVMADEVEKPEKITVMFDVPFSHRRTDRQSSRQDGKSLPVLTFRLFSQTIHSTMMY